MLGSADIVAFAPTREPRKAHTFYETTLGLELISEDSFAIVFNANGVQLGWLIDPYKRDVYIYRPDRSVECLHNPEKLYGDPALPGFVFDTAEVWQQ